MIIIREITKETDIQYIKENDKLLVWALKATDEIRGGKECGKLDKFRDTTSEAPSITRG